jgi:hypothetical protein
MSPTKKRAPKAPKAPKADKRQSAAHEEEPFEGKEIGRADPSFRGAEQRGPGMNKGRGSAGSTTED